MANVIRKVKEAEFVVSNSWLATKSTLLKLECGHFANWSRPGHDRSNLPAEMECPTCGDIEAKRQMFITLKEQGVLSHTRARPRFNTCGSTEYYTVSVYRRDPTSPTGVVFAMSMADIPEFADLLSGGLSPLSPTER